MTDIVITGASNGIGKYLSEYFHSTINTVHGICHSSNDSLLPKVDISDYKQVDFWIRSLQSSGHLKGNIVLINCAGISYNSFAHKSDAEKWKKVIDVNLTGTFNVIRCLLPIMRENNYGRIINLSSVVAQKGAVGTSAYAASKAALWGLSKSIAVENAPKNITINSLNLGYFDIGMIRDVPSDLQEKIKSNIPIGKFGDKKEIVNAIDMLIKSSYMTGSEIDINGGLV